MRANEFTVEAKLVMPRAMPPKIPAKTPDDVTRIAAQISSDCAPFIADLRRAGKTKILYRGLSRYFGVVSKLPVPTNRKPRDTDVKAHKIVDDWFFKKTGVRYRSNATFATSAWFDASTYADSASGTVYTIWPVGNYRICWSPEVSDLTYGLLDVVGLDNNDIPELLDNAEYREGDLRGALKSGSEIMIHCQEYYVIHGNSDIGKQIINAIKGNNASK